MPCVAGGATLGYLLPDTIEDRMKYYRRTPNIRPREKAHQNIYTSKIHPCISHEYTPMCLFYYMENILELERRLGHHVQNNCSSSVDIP